MMDLSYLLIFVLTLEKIDRPEWAGLAWDWREVYKGWVPWFPFSDLSLI